MNDRGAAESDEVWDSFEGTQPAYARINPLSGSVARLLAVSEVRDLGPRMFEAMPLTPLMTPSPGETLLWIWRLPLVVKRYISTFSWKTQVVFLQLDRSSRGCTARLTISNAAELPSLEPL
mgnify:CR=1 FL=1